MSTKLPKIFQTAERNQWVQNNSYIKIPVSGSLGYPKNLEHPLEFYPFTTFTWSGVVFDRCRTSEEKGKSGRLRSILQHPRFSFGTHQIIEVLKYIARIVFQINRFLRFTDIFQDFFDFQVILQRFFRFWKIFSQNCTGFFWVVCPFEDSEHLHLAYTAHLPTRILAENDIMMLKVS